MFGLGTTELILILIIILVLFGAGKLPEIGNSIGKAIKSFKKATSDDVVETEKEKPKESEKNKKA